jgi:predicted AAA+ superfamily ATPase
MASSITHPGRLVVVDNIAPHAAPLLIDAVRASESMRPPPRFLLLGSDAVSASLLAAGLIGIAASVDLPTVQFEEMLAASQPSVEAHGPIRQTSQPLLLRNTPQWDQAEHWLRGGLPESLNADCGRTSFRWRVEYLIALLNSDYRQMGIHTSDRLIDVIQWLANGQGQIFDEIKCGKTLGLGRDSVRNSIGLLQKLGLLRRLENWPMRTNASMGRMPVYYIRDSGLMHALVGIETQNHLENHDLRGHSWESCVVEALVTASTGYATPGYYRDASGDEIDLILEFIGRNRIILAVECKVSPDKDVEAGFGRACAAIGANRQMVVHSGSSAKRHRSGVDALPLLQAVREVRRICAEEVTVSSATRGLS